MKPEQRKQRGTREHTPGPWVVSGERYTSDGAKAVSLESKGRHICSFYENSNANFEADSRLTAAAPELLAALECCAEFIKTARRYFPKSIRNHDRFELENLNANTITKAIRKAKGEV